MYALRLAALLVLVAVPAHAETAPPPRLGLPLDCRLGETCWLMNYPDTDPGPAAKDMACRPRSYDGHDGTDIAVRDVATQARGVPVLAAAAGKVVGVRDGEPDGLWMAGRSAEVKASGKECGNRVAIAHGNGWVTDYCHLRQGSVRVKQGDVVAAGQPIAQVGLSGGTEFPHVHLTLLHFKPGEKRGTPVDPGSGAPLAAGCGQPRQPAWGVDFPYQPAALYAAGFAPAVPDMAKLKADAASPDQLPPDAPGMVLWAALFGVAPGDRVTVTMTAPDGSRMVDSTQAMDRDQAWRMVALGKKRPGAAWPAGVYQGKVVFERDGMAPQSRSLQVTVR